MKRTTKAAGVGVLALSLGFLGWGPSWAGADSKDSTSADSTHAAGDAKPTQCQAEELPLPANAPDDVRVEDADPTGTQIVASANTGDGSGAGYLWSDGADPEALEFPDSDVGWLDAVNDSGVVIGGSTIGEAYYKSFKYENGTYTDFGEDDAYTLGYDINANADIVGTPEEYTEKPKVVWPAGDVDGTPVELPSSGDKTATAISDEGVIIGGNGDGAYMWPDMNSEPEALEMPSDVDSSETYRISGSWVIGDAGVRWNLDDGSAEALGHAADSVNSSGDVGSAAAGGILRADGTTVELPSLDGFELDTVIVLDEGSEYTAVGTVVSGDTKAKPVRWTC